MDTRVGSAPVFSFIIVSYNNSGLLPACIGSIYDNVKRSRFEIVVSDNGSTDGSDSLIRSRWPDITLIENRKNLGFAAAVNRGIAVARGDYIVLMNSDAELTPGAIEVIGAFLDDHRDVAIAGGRLIDPDGTPQNSAAAFPGMATEFGLKPLLKIASPKRFPGRVTGEAHPLDVDSIIGALMVVRMEAIRRVGPLDEDYFFFLEETDWCLRMKRAGMRVVVVPEARIIHHQGKTAKRYPTRAKIEYYRSLITFMEKNRRRPYAWLFVLGLAVKFAVSLVLQAVVCGFTLCIVEGPRRRLARYAGLLGWIVSGRPAARGLTGIKPSRSS
jgi:GT2 family glycosyltransferase